MNVHQVKMHVARIECRRCRRRSLFAMRICGRTLAEFRRAASQHFHKRGWDVKDELCPEHQDFVPLAADAMGIQ